MYLLAYSLYFTMYNHTLMICLTPNKRELYYNYLYKKSGIKHEIHLHITLTFHAIFGYPLLVTMTILFLMVSHDVIQPVKPSILPLKTHSPAFHVHIL